MINLQNWADTYSQKLIECGHKHVASCVFENHVYVVFEASEKEANFAIFTLMLKKDFSLKKLDEMYIDDEIPQGSPLRDVFVNAESDELYCFKIAVDDSFDKPITDRSRLDNILSNRHLSSPYEAHAKRFVESIKFFYDIDFSIEMYNLLCKQQTATYKLTQIYKLNGRTFVGKMWFGKWVYVIYGGGGNDRNIPPYKTTLPNLYDEKTLLPVPHFLQFVGLDRLEFSKQVRETMAAKRLHYEKLSADLSYMSDKDLYLSDDISKQDKAFLMKLRKETPIQYDINDAIRHIGEKYSRRRGVPGTAPTSDDDRG